MSVSWLDTEVGVNGTAKSGFPLHPHPVLFSLLPTSEWQRVMRQKKLKNKRLADGCLNKLGWESKIKPSRQNLPKGCPDPSAETYFIKVQLRFSIPHTKRCPTENFTEKLEQKMWCWSAATAHQLVSDNFRVITNSYFLLNLSEGKFSNWVTPQPGMKERLTFIPDTIGPASASLAATRCSLSMKPFQVVPSIRR